MTDAKTFTEALANVQKALPPIGKNKTAKVPTKTGGSYCLDPSARVLLHDLSWTDAGKLAEGDEIVAFDEYAPDGIRCRRWRRATVQKVAEVTLPAYKVTLSDGTSVISSETHRWLTSTGANEMKWTDTRLLRGSDRFKYPHHIVRATDVWEMDQSREAGYLAGAYDGEGCLVQTPIIRSDGETFREQTFQLHCLFSQRENAMFDRVDAHLAHLGFSVQRQAAHTGTNKDVATLRIGGGRPEVLRLLGQIRPSRLLANFDADRLGTFRTKARVQVASVEFLGERTLIATETSTATLIVEGLASHNSYSYADLADIQPVILPLLAAQGLSWVTKPTMTESGFVLEYALTHVSGQQESGQYPLPDPRVRTAQEVGSAITYARRYTLCCVVGVVPDEDEDGHLATVSHVIEPVPPQLPGTALKNEIAALGDKLGLTRGEVSELWHAERGTSIRDTQDVKALRAFRAELQTRLGEVDGRK